MSHDLQRLGQIPTTLQGWEEILTKALLRADTGNSDPLRSFEITPATLAEACGLGAHYGPAAEDAFRLALRSYHHLQYCLKNGAWKTPGAAVPNCMAVLALSLLVDSLLDGDYSDKGQYRAKLAQWLGLDRSFMDLRGIAAMWEGLVKWLDRQADDGAPFRRLILPNSPKSWTHIGYTRYLSFPTKRDIAFLHKHLERNKRYANDPAGLVLTLDAAIVTAHVSYGLRTAFQDFRKALRAGMASTDHRFWRLLSRAKDLIGATQPPLAQLRIEFDEDGRRTYRIGAEGNGSTSLIPDVGTAARSPTLLESSNLGPSIRRGIIFFRSVGLASWSASGEPPIASGAFHVAIAETHTRLATGSRIRFEKSGSWLISVDPASSAAITELLKLLRIVNVKEAVRSVGLADGVRVGNAWLGQPRYLPYLDGAVGTVEIRSDRAEGAPLAWLDNRLSADRPFEGEVTFEDRAAGWSRRAAFVTTAVVHPGHDGRSHSFQLAREWDAPSSTKLLSARDTDLEWEDGQYPLQDMIEALYASARSGIGEGDAVDLISRAAGRRSWEVLRTLQEATFFDARLRPQWRGRELTLGRPRLQEILLAGRTGVAVSGAIPEKLEADFRASVDALGGVPFRRADEASLAPQFLGAVIPDPGALSEALGWPLNGNAPSFAGGVGAGVISTVTGATYQPASAWDWQIGRFRAGAAAGGPVSLTRLVHPGGRDHDIYQVGNGVPRNFLSRHAAIVAAHLEARVPLFAFEKGHVRRLAKEGALPVEISRELRLRTLRNAGAHQDGWRYEMSLAQAKWLDRILPGLIEGIGNADRADLAQSFRRGRGARRPMWMNGSLAA